jgi:uncharacterized protein YsxB (DUF464 family)
VLRVTFYRDARGRRIGIDALGHAESERRGNDLVCAAASAILQAARLGLERHAKVALDAVQRPGELRLRWPARTRDMATIDAIIATAELSIAQLAKQYPKHVRYHRSRLSANGG